MVSIGGWPWWKPKDPNWAEGAKEAKGEGNQGSEGTQGLAHAEGG